MGAEIIDFRDKQYKHDYELMINSFRAYRFSSKDKIERKCVELWVQEDKEGLHYLSEFYKYFEDANKFVEYYIEQLNDSDKNYEERTELLSCLFGYYEKYIGALEQGETYLFAEMVNDLVEQEEEKEEE